MPTKRSGSNSGAPRATAPALCYARGMKPFALAQCGGGRWWKIFLLVSLSCAVCAAAPTRVNELREAGKAAFQEQRYQTAKRAFERAYRTSKLHSLGVWVARTHAKLDELTQATRVLNQLIAMPLPSDAPPEEKQARQTALQLWNTLREEVPRLRIVVAGVKPSELVVKVDGQTVGSEFLQKVKKGPFRRGKSLELNPGTHRVVGVYSSDLERHVSITLKRGQRRSVRLEFPNPDTLRQRKCRDSCRSRCEGDNPCYVDCKTKCFTKKKKERGKRSRSN